MGFCTYFRRTWIPGYNGDCIDPNLAYSYQKRLDLAKKIAWWLFVLALITSVIILLVTLTRRSQDSLGDGESLVNCSGEEGTGTGAPPPVAEEWLGAEVAAEAISRISRDGPSTTENDEDPTTTIVSTDPGESTTPVTTEKGKDTTERIIAESDVESTPATSYETTAKRLEVEDSDVPCGRGTNHFVCQYSHSSEPLECIHKDLVCDNVKDCSNGFDEQFCTAVSPSLTEMTMDKSQDKLAGYVMVRAKGIWSPYCNRWSVEPMPMGEKVCKHLGYDTLLKLEISDVNDLPQPEVQLPNSNDHPGNSSRKLWLLSRRNDTTNTGPIQGLISETFANDISCKIAYISCSKNY